MAAASIPTTSEIKTNSLRNKQDENARHPTVEELLIQIENHLYKSIEHRASLLIAVWSCLAGRIGYFRNMEKIFHMLYRESALTIFCGQWSRVNLLFKRGLSRALIHFSHSMGHYIKGAEGICSALVMAAYDPWGDPVIHKLLKKEDVDQQSINDFIKSEPLELLVIRVECLVNAQFEEAAIRLCRCCLTSHIFKENGKDEIAVDDSWRWIFMEWLLRLLFRKGKLNDLVAESEACSCHDGVRLIYRTRSSSLDDSEPLTETLINLFLVRDLLFQSNYCCTSELMSLWCDFQVQKQRTVVEIQYAAQKLLVGHASSSAQFYLFVDILWRKFGASLLPLYIEMYVRGLTSDLNYLEAARQADNKEYVIELENHMAAMYFKLSSMFNTINKEISLECMLSSFSLDPTKERLDCIKRLSLQISKEKALKAATENESCKHKLYNKSSCAYPHPASVKKKAVIMCDQAIQVGDGLFEDDCELLAPINYTLNKNIELMNGSSIISGAQNDKSVILKNLSSDKKMNIVKEKEIDQKEQNEKNCSSEKLKNESMISVDSKSGTTKIYASHKQCSENKESSEIETGELNNINCDDNENQKYLSNSDFDKNCNCHTSENFLPHNGEIYELPKQSVKTGDIDCNDSQSPISCKAHCRDIHISENVTLKELTLKSHNIKENGFASQSDTDSSNSTCKNTIGNVDTVNVDNKSDTNQHHNCLNGFEEVKDLGEDNRLQDSKHSNISNEKVANSEKDMKASDGCKKSVANSDECNTEICEQEPLSENNKINNPENTANISLNNEIAVKDNNKCKMNGEININSKSLCSVEANDNSQELHPFSHIVLDSKSLGISDDMLSDFVIVLESLRNKQLKSSNKWSQIKHLCEDYLVNVTNSRCIMLNMQLNESVDSEADSVSEVTTGLKQFESHQSDDSVVEDHCVDKSHVFKRFMNSDKNAEMATYVNLSDIHCPQIPLEKLFCTEHSSSHIVHKKRHKKHRNHDKNPEKVVLRKLRHGDHADHDVVKRKKRKKRKGKRTKNHVKKHHFTHGKTNKNCQKTKKKKHKLKKKKEERNSGFISGDYCSDFSSAELMRLVKEHSHSYSKLPATTSKHPHSGGSSSDEPTRKKRKVSFDKKKQKTVKYHDKHKHIKSKSSKRKKKLPAIQNCPETVKNITDHTMHGKIDTVNDYSRIVQYSSVKKLGAVQIRQRSLALNLSEVAKVSQEPKSRNVLVDPCSSNAQLQQFVQQNFESSEDIMKMQLLMAQQQPEMRPIGSNTRDYNQINMSATNQAVLKYVCSKMTSHLLSVAQASNCVSSDTEGSKTPLPAHTNRTLPSQTSNLQPQNLTANMKQVIIERAGAPCKISSNSTSLAGSALVPVSCLSTSSTQDSPNVTGTVISGGITYPATVASPQMTTFTIPVSHNPSGGKLVASKIVIPVNQCGNVRANIPTSVTLSESNVRTLASTSSSSPISGVIIVKNGNNTQIISAVQPPSSVMPCLPAARVTLPPNRSKLSPVVTKTVPKMIKQAAKTLSQPPIKKSVVKTICTSKPVPTSTNSEVPHDPIVATRLLSISDSDVNKGGTVTTSTNDDTLKVEATDLTTIKVSSVSQETSKDISCSPKKSSSPIPDNQPVQETVDKHDIDKVEINSTEICNETTTCVNNSPNTVVCSSPVNDTVLSVTETATKLLIPSPKDDKPIKSSESVQEDSNFAKNEAEIVLETSAEKCDKNDKLSILEENDVITPVKDPVPSKMQIEDTKSISPLHPDKKEDIVSTTIKSPETPKNVKDTITMDRIAAIIEEHKNLPQTNEKKPMKTMSARRTNRSPIKAVTLSLSDQEKQLQPISDSETSNGKASPKANSQNKVEGANKTSDAPTRSFTSISDAVRFSLMDMDDATDSVENQVVLQAFQTSHASSPASPTYAASESGEEHNSASPTSAVMLSAPQSTDATELSVGRVSQRFEPSVHSQTEKFPDCQSNVTRATSWIMEDSITETANAVTVQKSPDIDSCGEGKDDDKPKKKRKKKERVDNDITHKFWCQICSKGFFSAYNLRRHCRNVHKMDLPKGSSDNPFANTSQCLPHVQADTTTSETSSSRLSYGNVQTSCVSPNKGTEYSLLSPTHDAKNQEFPVKTGQHLPQIQTAEFQMQTPPRIASQSSTAHVSPVVPPKDFRHGTPTSVPSTQISSNKMSPVKSPSQSKFQRLSAGSQVPQMAKISQMQQIALCGQQALQQQRQMGQLQSPSLIQPLPSVACQAQQMQTNQCPHFQANKQIVQQRIGQLQLMHHVAQLPTVPHSAHGIQKPAQNPSYKKCSTNQGSSKMSENEQMQQAAQIAQNQQILANQQMQKLIQIRQSAIATSGIASQLSLANAIPNVPGSPVKGGTQCFQSQLAAARQAAVVSQIPTAQRAQGTSYNLPSHDTPGHQFFSPGVQPNQEQSSCPHSSFNTQNMSEFSSTTPSYPTIRLSSEANDGLEDLEQFLLENMPWSGEQSSAHGLAQQSGNRPSSADSLTLTIPSQSSVTSQNRGVTSKGKTSISRPKPRKPVTTQCSKNLLGNLGRGVKKKACSKKNSKTLETECTASKPEVYSQAALVPQPHELKTFNKDSMGTLSTFPKQTVKNSSVGVLNETDSSDSVQCINVTHNTTPKNAPVGINFNIFSPVGLCTPDKSTELIGNPPSCKEVYDAQRKNSFLDHSNLAATSSLNLDQSKNAMNMNQCQINPVNIGSAFNPTGKSQTMKPYCPTPVASQYGITNETPNPQDIFLGQRNSETSDSNNGDLKDKIAPSNVTSLIATVAETDIQALSVKEPLIEKNLFLGGSSKSSDEKSELLTNKEQTKSDSVDGIVSVPEDSNSSVTVDNIELKGNSLTDSVCFNNNELGENNSVVKTSIEKNKDINLSMNDKNSDKSLIAKDNINSSEQKNSKVGKKEIKCKSKNGVVKIKAEKSKKMAMEKNNLDNNNNNNNENIMTDIVENLKKKQTLSSCTEMCDNNVIDTCGTKSKRSTEEKSFLPKLVNHDEHSSQNGILNDENHLPKKNDIENMGSDIGMNRIALRVRKPQDTSNKPIEIDKKVQYFTAEKEDVKNQIVKKNSKKKKNKQENIKNENVISDNKISYKLDGDTKIQKTGLLNNVNKEKEINRSLCMLTTCYDGIKNNNSIQNETNGDSFCLDGKQLEETNVDGIPAARLRLRDTPKTSVKRVCPCCVDSKMPKKCRANGGGNIGTKVSNNLKNKSTLKTRNATNGHNGKVNTRSSQRLRSRNNAIS